MRTESSHRQHMQRAKSILCILIAALIYVPQSGAAQSRSKVTIDVRGATVAEVFSMIEKQSDNMFTYNNEQVSALPRVNISVKDAEIADVINRCLSGSKLEWTLVDSNYVIRMRQQPVRNTVEITGTVIDQDGKPIIGAIVILENSPTIGAITDVRGIYKIKVTPTENSRLVFSCLGKEKMIQLIGTRTVINVTLVESSENIEAVVVTGYGNINRNSFTGSSVTVSKQDLLQVSNRNPIDALQVFDPSLRIMLNNEMGSAPNTLPELYIRGQSGMA